jgi:hypothetical protein
VPGWLLTARVSAFAYGPLMIVPGLVAVGTIFDGRLVAVPAVAVWLAAGFVTTYAVLFTTFFLLRGAGWARVGLVTITVLVLAVHLPLCWWLLGVDGLIRDGGPLAVAAGLVLYALWTHRRRTGSRPSPEGSPVPRPVG